MIDVFLPSYLGMQSSRNNTSCLIGLQRAVPRILRRLLRWQLFTLEMLLYDWLNKIQPSVEFNYMNSVIVNGVSSSFRHFTSRKSHLWPHYKRINMEPLEALPYLSKKVINFAHKQNLLIQYSEGIFSSYERAVTLKLLLERQKTMLVLTAP